MTPLLDHAGELPDELRDAQRGLLDDRRRLRDPGIGSAMEANPGFFIFSDTEPPPGKGFYRVAWIPEE